MSSETRIWRREPGSTPWQCCHIHRSNVLQNSTSWVETIITAYRWYSWSMPFVTHNALLCIYAVPFLRLSLQYKHFRVLYHFFIESCRSITLHYIYSSKLHWDDISWFRGFWWAGWRTGTTWGAWRVWSLCFCWCSVIANAFIGWNSTVKLILLQGLYVSCPISGQAR